MTNSEGLFPYLGDNPVHVARFADQLTATGESLSRLAQSLALGRTMLNLAWTGAGSDVCDADVGVLATGLPVIQARLVTAQTAVAEYQLALTTGRSEVDDIRNRWDHQVVRYELAKTSLDGLIGSTRPADAIQADSDKAAMNAANTALEQIDADYQRLVLASNNSAQHCCTSLINAWNSTGQPTGGAGPSAGMMLLTQGGMGGSNLAVLHATHMDQFAKDAQAELAGLDDVTLDPAERNARIRTVLQEYSQYASDPAFATAVAIGLGQDYFRDLQSELGGYQKFWGAQEGNENFQLDSKLFAFSAAVLSGATDSSQQWHVSDQWLHDLTHDDHGGVQPGWVMAASDYLRVGVPFSHVYLDEVGQSAIDWEKQRPGGTGDPWQGWGWERFTGGVPSSDPPQGTEADPLEVVVAHYAEHPDGASSLFSSGPIDPHTQRPTDPAAGNLMWLLHRRWTDGGEQQLGAALDAMTSPASGDVQAAGALAYNVFDAVSRGDGGLGMETPWGEGQLAGGTRDGIANIAARYMGSIIYTNQGQEPGSDGLFASGFATEGRVASVAFANDENTAKTLSWLLHDTENTAVRDAIYSGWRTASAAGIGEDLYAAEQASGRGDNATMLQEVAQTRSHTAGSAQALGLITQSDIKAFEDAGAKDADDMASARSGAKTAVVIGKEILGATGIPGRVISAAVGIVNNMFVDQVLTADSVAGAATDDIQLSASLDLRGMTAGLVTSLSSRNIPVISVYDLDSLVVDHQSAAIPNIATIPGAANFTDSSGHLLPYETIYAKDADGHAADPQAIRDFERWYNSTGFFGDSSGWPELQAEFETGYRRGMDGAQS